MLVQDPVCSTELDDSKADQLSIYHGEPYYFCCPGCQAAFDENPEKYVVGSDPTNETAQPGNSEA